MNNIQCKSDEEISEELVTSAEPAHSHSTVRVRDAKFNVGQCVMHKHLGFKGIIFDVDPEFSSTDEWLLSIPEEIRPSKDQPFYHLVVSSDNNDYLAMVSEQNIRLCGDDHEIETSDLADKMLEQDEFGNWKPRDIEFH